MKPVNALLTVPELRCNCGPCLEFQISLNQKIALIGIIAGTFSSMFIATPIMVWWYRGKRPQFEKVEKKPQA